MKHAAPKLLTLSNRIDAFSNAIGHGVAWLSLGMVLLMALTVVERYLFSASFIWQQELVRYFHAILFLSAVSYTLLQDEHVRVDVLYQRFNRKQRAWLNMFGVLVFIFPMCIAIMIFSEDFVLRSWHYLEASPEYNGMPGLFILKSFIWVFCALLIMQGIATLCRGWLTIHDIAINPRDIEEHQHIL